MKNTVKYFLQKALGFKNYLYVFALFKIRTLKSDAKEKDFFHFLKLIEDSKGLVLDIGANLGIMSYHLAKNFPNTKIHAFEPIPENFRVLKKIKTKFGLRNVELHELALGAEKQQAKMILPKQNQVLMQGLSHVRHESIAEMPEGVEFEVPMDCLDNVLNGEVVQAIKLDVENFEYFVLQGGQRIIAQHHPIIYAELWENENRKNCMEFLKNLTYNTFVIENGKMELYNPVRHKNQNFIFMADYGSVV